MEAQFSRVAKKFWQINAELELTEIWTDRLADMYASLRRYRKNAYEFITTRRKQDYWIGDAETYPVPASVYAKK